VINDIQASIHSSRVFFSLSFSSPLSTCPHNTAMMPSDCNYLEQLERDGFVVVKAILTPDALSALRDCSSIVVENARCGKWPHVRVLGKQFPPWESTTEHGIWGVQHLMNPDMPGNAQFAEVYFSEEVLGISKQLLQCDDDDLVMELFNMLIRPESDFELRWHRDDIPPEATDEEEMERLREPPWHAQYNLALWHDDSLIVVPGSHLRPRTQTERSADPLEKDLAGQLIVELEPGDIVFYNNNILHRGAYRSSKERMTLHGSVGHVKGNKLRARNVLQHGIGSWVDQCDFTTLGETQGARAEAMRQRLVKMGSDGSEVGYSLRG
jgi:EEF1A N-terminal glycine/lysine methyltransferase